MKRKAELTGEFACSVERAFKTPILGDATKFLNGYLFQPPVVGFKDDSTWGKVGGIRYPLTNGNFFMPKGIAFTDKILSRTENKMWMWTIYDFKVPAMFFAEKAIGEWEVKAIEENRISVRYCYTFYSKNKFCHVFSILFIAVQWKGMMKKALSAIKKQAESNEVLVYEKE
ncbi:MAG: hypothetical protein ACXVP0_16710 [Bacteroidia bacterium]